VETGYLPAEPLNFARSWCVQRCWPREGLFDDVDIACMRHLEDLFSEHVIPRVVRLPGWLGNDRRWRVLSEFLRSGWDVHLGRTVMMGWQSKVDFGSVEGYLGRYGCATFWFCISGLGFADVRG